MTAASEREVIEGVARGHTTLADAIAWGAALRPPRMVAGVIVQDEYTHDIILPYRADLVLVYDTT